MTQILDYHEAFLEMIYIKHRKKKDLSELPENISKIIQNVEFPSFSTFQRMRIKKELLDHSGTVQEILKNYGFSFNMSIDDLFSLIKLESDDEDLIIIISLCVFYSFFQEIVISGRNDVLFEFLELLGCISSQERFSIDQKIQNINVSLLYYSMGYGMSSELSNEIKKFFVSLYDFYYFHKDIPQKAFSLLFQASTIVYSGAFDKSLQIEFISITDGLIQQLIHIFPPKIAESIVFRCGGIFRKLDVSALSFLLHAIPLLSEDALHSIVFLFPPAIDEIILSWNIRFYAPVPKTKNLRIGQMESHEVSLCPVRHITFNNEDIIRTFSFPVLIEFEKMLPSNVLSQFQLLLKIISVNEKVAQTFIDASTPFIIHSLENDYFLDYYTVFLYFFVNISSKHHLSYNNRLLFNPQLFNPDVTILDNLEGYEHINSIRFYAMEIIIKEISALKSILIDTIQNPSLFCEIVYRIIYLRPKFTLDESRITSFIPLLMKPMVYYQSLQLDSQEEMFFIQMARSSIFTFLENEFMNSNSISLFFSNVYFTKTFFALIFEAPVRTFVLKYIAQYLSSGPSLSLVQFPQIVQLSSIVFGSSFLNDDKTRYLDISTCLISSLNSSLRINTSLIPSLEPLSAILFSEISQLVFQSGLYEFLSEFVSFLVLVSPSHTISHHESVILQTSFSLLGSIPTKDPLMWKIVQLIAGMEILISNNSFIIKQSYALEIYMRASLESNDLIESVRVLIDLFSYSQRNMIKAHEGELDMFIISVLQEKSSSEFIDICSIQALFDILKLITQTTCSVAVVQHFISILCPVDGRFLPVFHENSLDFLSSVFDNANRVPRSSWALKENAQIDIKGLNYLNLSNGFCFSFWILPIYSESQISLFSLQDSSDFRVSVLFSTRIMKIEIVSPDFLWSNNVIECFPMNSWQYISVRMFAGITTQVSVFIGKSIVYERNDIPAIRFKKGPVLCIINKQRKAIQIDDIASYLGPFGLLTYSSDFDPVSLFPQGPRFFQPPEQYILFAYSPLELSGRFSLVDLSKNESVIASYFRTRVRHNIPFPDVLIHGCSLSALLPLFAQTDMIKKDGSKLEGMLLKSIKILSSALLLSNRGQEYFADSDNILIIEHLLNQTNPIHITYSVYLAFYDLFTKIRYYRLQQQIFDHIVFNICLWIDANPIEHNRIICHWFKVVFPKYSAFLFDCRPLSWFLFNLRTFYWYEYNEFSLKKDRFQNQEANIHQIRSIILKIAYFVSQFHFDDNDFRLLINHIVEIKDISQVLDLINFLMKIITSGFINGFVSDIITAQLTRLHECFRLFDSKLFFSLIHLYILVHSLGLFSIPQGDHFYWILCDMGDCYISKKFFVRVIKVLPQVPDLLPICSWIAFNLGKHGIKVLCKSLIRNHSIRPNNMYDIWTIACLFRASTKKAVHICRFLVRGWFNELPKIYSRCEMVSRALGIESRVILSLLLRESCDFLVHNSSLDPIPVLQLIKGFIFIHNDGLFNQSIIQCYMSSPFLSVIIETNKIEQISFYRISSSALETLIFQAPLPTKNLRVGLFFFDSKWADEELATKTVSVVSLFRALNFYDMSSVLTSFLIRSNPCTASPIMPHNSKDSTFSSLVSYQLMKVGQPIGSSKRIEELVYCSFYSLEQFFSNIYTIILNGNPFGSNSEQRFVNRPRISSRLSDSGPESLVTSIDYKEIIDQEKQKCNKKWQSIWRSLTTKRAPWHRSLSKNMRSPKFKRDSSIYQHFCPVKLKRLYSFDDHMSASFLRDFGDDSQAQERLETYRAKAAKESTIIVPAEIINVQDNHEQNSPNSAKYGKSKKKYSNEISCMLVTIKGSFESKFQIFEDHYIISRNNGKTKIVLFEDIRSIFLRTYVHHQTAIEVFTYHHTSMFINFPQKPVKSIIAMFKKSEFLKHCIIQQTNFRQFFSDTNITNLWIERKISNFEYLIYLNMYSGRSFNSPSQYPFFPWILSDYDSENIDLKDEKYYRDLSKPIGALNSDRLKELISKSQELSALGMDPYLYSSGPVCPLSVFLWLIRMEPFTSQHIDIQGGRFDHAARLFVSISDSFRLAKTHMNNFRELIPEFFISHEFLVNSNGFDLGIYNGLPASNVQLPPWSSNPSEFIYIQRKALESEYVSSHLNEWIDLVWGYKQRGEDAENSNNLFKKEMYSDVWDDPENLKDPNAKAAIEAVLSQVGQIPPQLFIEKHIPRQQMIKPVPKMRRQITLTIEMSSLIYSASHMKENHRFVLYLVSKSGIIIKSKYNFSKLLASLPSFSSVTRRQRSRSLLPDRNSERVKSMEFNEPLSDMITQEPIPAGCKLWNVQISSFPTVFSHNATYTSLSKGDILFVGSEENDLYHIYPETGSYAHQYTFPSDIVSLSQHNEWFAISFRNAKVLLYKNWNFSAPFASIDTYCDSIKCSSIDSDYDAYVCGTRDGFILFCSLSRGEVIRVIDLEGYIPHLLLITKEFGFVLVSSQAFINGKLTFRVQIFNINGELISTRTLDNPITMWVTWKTKEFLDYILAADIKGKVYVLEAFYLDFSTIIHRCGSKICHLNVDPNENVAIAVTEDSKINIIPFDI